MRGTRAALAAVALLAAGCGDLRVIPEGARVEPAEAPVSMAGLRMRSYSGPDLWQVIAADRADLYVQAQQATLENLSMAFYQGAEVVSSLQADHGVADLRNDEFRAEGRRQRIRLTREDQNVVLYAPQLVYDPERNQLSTEGEFVLVQLFEGGMAQVVRGVGVTTDPRLDRVELRRPRIERQSHLDLEAFEREVRPLTQENQP